MAPIATNSAKAGACYCPSNPSSHVYILVIVALATLVVLLVIAFVGLHRRYKRSLKMNKIMEYLGHGCENVDLPTVRETSNLDFPPEYEISKSKVELTELLGDKGHFGLLYQGKLFLPGGESAPVSVKTPHPNSVCSLRAIMSELRVLSRVGSHPHLVSFYGAYVREVEKGVAYVVTELCENGWLQDHLVGMREEVLRDGDEERSFFFELCRFSNELALGLDFLAEKKIVFLGGLTTASILLDSEWHCKISGFGMARKLEGEDEEYVLREQIPLPWRWMAVESLKSQKFSTKSDVWSFGITLGEIFSLGAAPYPGKNWSVAFVQELEGGMRPDPPRFSSTEIYGKMTACWNSDPEQRPTFKELAEFFGNIRSQEYFRI